MGMKMPLCGRIVGRNIRMFGTIRGRNRKYIEKSQS